MAIAEDAASVLEQFVQDVANLPAEIAHLLEEIQAKDRTIQECRNTIHARDNSIQKFIKANGSHIPNPKEEAYSRTVLANYDRVQIVQEEKVGLSEKAAIIVRSSPTSNTTRTSNMTQWKLDRHIKRLDLKIRDLQNEGTISTDPPLPSLLHPSTANRVPPISTSSTGASTPLNPLSGNAGPSTTIANSSITRLAHPLPTGHRNGSPSIINPLQLHHPLLASAHHLGTSAPTTPGSTTATQVHRHRESSAGAPSDFKRRRFGQALGSLPSTSSGLARQSSLGPGTPKAGTPAGSTRGGSVGPRAGLNKKGASTANKRVAPHHQHLRRLNPPGKQQKRKSGKRLTLGMTKASPSEDTGDDESLLSEVDGSESENPRRSHSQLPGGGGGGEAAGMEDEEMEDVGGDEDDDDAGDDGRKYCTCHGVSYGSMVACDNAECPYEWFHWSCVGITKEPQGRWYCDECRGRMLALGEGAGGGGK